MTDALEGFGQNVEQESTDELISIQNHVARLPGFAIAIEKRHFAVANRNNPVIGDRDAVSITAQIREDGFGGRKRPFGIDDPFLAAKLGLELAPAMRCRPDFTSSVKLQLFFCKSGVQKGEELRSKDNTESADMK